MIPDWFTLRDLFWLLLWWLSVSAVLVVPVAIVLHATKEGDA